MQPRRFKRQGQKRATIITAWMLSLAIALLGCNNNVDNVTAQDVANRTFIFDSSFIDTNLEGLTTRLEFESATDATHLPFTLTLQDAVTSTDEAIVSDTATVSSISLPVVGVIALHEVTLPDPIVFDVNVDEEDDGTIVFTFTNDSGDQLSFEFEVGERSAVATPVSL